MIASDEFEEFCAAAAQALTVEAPADALRELGWLEFLDDTTPGPERTMAILAPFAASGRVLAATPALSVLMAHPYLEAAGTVTTFEYGAAVILDDGAEQPTVAVPTEPSVCTVVLDVPGRGVLLADRDDITPLDTTLFDGAEFWAGQIPNRGQRELLTEDAARAPRRESGAWSRIAASCEILGACDALVALGVEHALAREQFGQPIASFAPVRELLANASVETEAIRFVCDASATGLSTSTSAPADLTEASVCIAVAQRGGRRVSDRVLQVLGATGFTREHAHHRFQRRVLQLGNLFGALDANLRALGTLTVDEGGLPETLFPLAGATREELQ